MEHLRVRIRVKARIRIHIKVRSRIRISIKVMRIRYTVLRASQEFLNPPPIIFSTTKLSTLIFFEIFEVLRLSSERYFICAALFERALRDYDKLRKREAFIDQFRKVRKENRYLCSRYLTASIVLSRKRARIYRYVAASQ